MTAALLGTTACSSIPQLNDRGNYSDPIGYSRVTENPTVYSKVLSCLGASFAQRSDLRITVSRIEDLTNTQSATSGGFVTRGAGLMLMSALAKARIPQVERSDMEVSKAELKFAMDKLLGHPDDEQYKKLLAGRIRSSDYFIAGGVSELNFNIRSNKGEIKSLELGLGARYAVMNVALDLRLVKTETLEIVNVVSMQKQIIAKEIKAGVFDLMGANYTIGLFNGKAVEPLQLGVRTVIERALIDLVSPLYEVDPQPCLMQS